MAQGVTEFILCVDDEFIVLESLKRELRQNPWFADMEIETFESGAEALLAANEILSDGNVIPVVISDQRMPGMNGNIFLEELKKRSPDTLCILLTGYSELEVITALVNKSVLYRFIPKPWARHDLLLTVSEACNQHRQKRLLESQTRTIERLSTILVTALESANEFYDEDTGAHIKRIPLVSGMLARFAGFDESFIKRIQLYSSLHDIGKVGISQEILRKPGKLTPAEFTEMQRHVVIGHKIIDQEGIDDMVKNIVLYHHEKWSGGGYVHGLSKDEIPVEARIVAISDVFDALISARVYKPAFPLEKVITIFREDRGISFDPELTDIFLDNIPEILAGIHKDRSEIITAGA
jgi:putative two-component system response regulator